MTATIEGIEAQLRSYNPHADTNELEEAYVFAAEKHAGQTRKSGEPFINHPLEVAMILASLHLDTATLQAALLHDVVEDSGVTLKEIRERFGPEVASLVDGVTKLGRIKFSSLAEAQANNMRKMLIAMAKDIRVILIKLADRLHNMRTLSALPLEKQRAKAIETMEIYAPLAHRLGISQIKWELEDLAFFYLEPRKFAQIERMVAESRAAREAYLEQVIAQLTQELEAVGIRSEISGRPKHLYSIYQKMTQRGKDFSEIYDLIALRVIVESVKDVYGALGTVHSIWKPMPGRFKDYVAMPKFNMYQSLHTTVIGPAGRPLEIQIRTEEMHRTAEYGIAAHWRYKEGAKDEDFDERLAWLRQMLEWQTELKDPREFMEALKIDLFEDEVYVFTPKGDVISLRRGSTPIDFAYAIHTEIGNHCVGAKVNGSIVPLSYELQMGDRVEVLTSKSANPSRDWLAVVRTSSARSKIRAYFSRVSRSDDVQAGREELLKVLRKQGMGLGTQGMSKALEAVAREMNLQSAEDLTAAIGAGKQSAKQVVTKLIKHLSKEPAAGARAEDTLKGLPPSQPMTPPRSKRRRPGGGVRVVGIDDMLVRLARCCNPVPGDEIVGFVTRGRGVSVHRKDCPNSRELLKQPERIIDVEWDTGTSAVYQVEIVIEALDRTRLLQDVSVALADAGVNVLSASVATDRQGIATMRFLLELGSMDQLDKVLRAVKGIDGVFDARRSLPEVGPKSKNRSGS
ncbi:MAG: bifunctional (p)ppGpp synthetase/guanosine-3',5'-bis(diphosphate) 3'-pyrophosphohydrolase [Coriobacteriales bacterium]|nr:bifunctional (p)ppGpp synthetase/guanosine-3',5'-bis(diphosphate) 3'-pyrophosphohydrolase [Actinomycetes bacterium]